MGKSRTFGDIGQDEFDTTVSVSYIDIIKALLDSKKALVPNANSNPYVLQLMNNLAAINQVFPEQEKLLGVKRDLQNQAVLNAYYGLRRSEAASYNLRLSGGNQTQKIAHIFEQFLKDMHAVQDYQLKVAKETLAPSINKGKLLPLHEKLAQEIRANTTDPSTRDQILFEIILSSRRAMAQFGDIKKEENIRPSANAVTPLEKAELQTTLIKLSKNLGHSAQPSQRNLASTLEQFLDREIPIERVNRQPKA